MGSASFRRESGVVFLAAVMVVMVLFATTTVAVHFSFSESSALSNREETMEAFYLAQGALEAAKHEIVLGVDADGDGLGALPPENGRFVDASETSGIYELTATGISSSGKTVVLETTLELVTTGGGTFSGGGTTFMGGFGTSDILFGLSGSTTLILDGGAGAALSFDNESNYNYFFDQLAGQGSNPNLTLSGDVTSERNGDELPITYEPPDPDYDHVAELEDLYIELDAKADELVGVASTTSSLSGTYGSEGSPVTVRLTSSQTLTGSVTGHGTLIVNSLTLGSGGSLDWTGDVFVLSGSLGLSGGVLDVTGNVLLLGQSSPVLYSASSGTATIDGNLFLASDSNNVEIELTGGQTIVNGTATIMGAGEVGLASNASVVVNGAMQFAKTGGELDLEMEGTSSLEVHVDNDQIAAGMAALSGLGVTHDVVPVAEGGGGGEQTSQVVVKSWTKKAGG